MLMLLLMMMKLLLLLLVLLMLMPNADVVAHDEVDDIDVNIIVDFVVVGVGRHVQRGGKPVQAEPGGVQERLFNKLQCC